MPQPTMFKWHEAATLYAGNTQLARPKTHKPSGFRANTSLPTAKALSALATALVAGDSFCLSQTPLPAGTTAHPGEFLTLTGGTTGAPKIICRTMASWIASFEVNARQFALTPQDTLAVLGDLSHSLALYGTLEGLHLGLNVHVLADLTPSQQRTALRACNVTILYATPTQLRLILGPGAQRFPDLRLILCGGGTLDGPTAKAIRASCPNAALHQFYGAAETSFITMTDAQTPQGAQGRPYPGVTLKTLDAHGRETPDIGEVWVQSPYLFEGYANATTGGATLRDGYVSVGELGWLDAKGNLYLTGRKSRQVRIADQTFSPEVIEAHLSNLADVQACAVLPTADDLRGHCLVAVLQAPASTALSQAARQSCRAEFGPLPTPKHVSLY